MMTHEASACRCNSRCKLAREWIADGEMGSTTLQGWWRGGCWMALRSMSTTCTTSNVRAPICGTLINLT